MFTQWALIALVFALLVGPSGARADELSGTWSGEVRGNMHYFKERSTRIFLPEGGITLESPNGIRFTADYLVDAITSASIAFAGSAEDELFTEYRHEPQLTVGKEFRLRRAKLDLTAIGRYSTENDYESMSAGAITRLSLNQDNTIVTASIVGLHDEIRANNQPNFADSVDSTTASVGLEQVLNPFMLLTTGYQLGALQGYLGNPYRRVLRLGAPLGESPPRSRYRHTLYGNLATYVPWFRGSVHLMLRGYADSWQVLALNPELRIYKELGDHLLLRFRYRYYVESDADFYRMVYPEDWPSNLTADPKLAGFQSHTVGLRIDFNTPFLARSIVDFAADSSIYASINYNITGIFYSDAWIGSGGAVMRF